MKSVYFEEIHRAGPQYPYLDFDMRNIEYIAHFHEEVEVIYLREGEVSITADSKVFSVKKDEICIFLPGEIHSFQSGGENWMYIFKILPAARMGTPDFSQMRLESQVLRPGQSGYREIRRAVERIERESREKKPGYEYAVAGESFQILAFIARLLPKKTVQPEERKKQLRQTQLLEEVGRYVEQNFAQPLSLEEMAKQCRLSKFYFAHTFKEATGMSFLDFLTSYRLDRAVAKIKMSEESITEIALSCGFSTLRSFHRAFQKTYKMTPTAYRKYVAAAMEEER